ncbi:MAG: hypothetical protein HRU09_18675 [Oligoflexales bacterium]|nr:hypothetical protein [Oligoflexales bacterium]
MAAVRFRSDTKYDKPDSKECEVLAKSFRLLNSHIFPSNLKKSDLKSTRLLLKLVNFEDEIILIVNTNRFYFLPRFSLSVLKEAGFSAGELKKSGVSLRRLVSAGFSIEGLIDAGFALRSFKNANVSSNLLRESGVSNFQLFLAGYPLRELLTNLF